MKLSRDINGNKVLKIEKSDVGARGFSIQTSGKLPKTHKHGLGPWSWSEAINYVKRYGTERQKELMDS